MENKNNNKMYSLNNVIIDLKAHESGTPKPPSLLIEQTLFSVYTF